MIVLRHLAYASGICLLFGTSLGFVLGRFVLPPTAIPSQVRVVRVQETFANDAYSCLEEVDGLPARCTDAKGSVVARIDLQGKLDLGIVEGADIVLTVDGTESRIPLDHFWAGKRLRCDFKRLEGNAASLGGTIKCTADGKDGGMMKEYDFEYGDEKPGLITDCTYVNLDPGSATSKFTETCHAYSQPQR